MQSWDFPEEVSHQIVQVMRQLIVVSFVVFFFNRFLFCFLAYHVAMIRTIERMLSFERRTRIATVPNASRLPDISERISRK